MSSENKSAEFKIIFEEIGKEYMDEFELLFNDVPFTGDNYSAELSRVEIRPLKSDGDSIHLFVKSAPTDPKNRKTVPPQIMFKTEIMLYSEVLPALNRLQEIYKIPLEDRFRVAKLYKSVIEEFKELMVMEDLSIEGFTLHDKRVPLDLDHVILLLKYFARLHATSFALRKHDPELFSKFNISQMHVFKDIWLPISRAIEPTVLQSIEFPRHKSLIESFVKRTVEILDSTLDASLTEPYNVICHGDCWSSNLLFKYKEGKVDKVIPVDWQVSRLGSPATDIAYMICMCTDLNSMRSHIDQMLDIYYETLREATARMDCDISVMFPKDVLIEHFKKYMLLALCIAFTGLPISLGDPESLMDIGSIVDTSQKRPIVNDRATQRIIGLIDYCVDSGLLK